MLTDGISQEQQAVITYPYQGRLYLEGPAGTGKSTVGAERLAYLIEQGVPGDSILVLSAQRSLADPYISRQQSIDLPPGSQPTILTVGGLAQRVVNLFWPLVSQKAGFGYPDRLPAFLTQETAKYYMSSAIQEKLDRGYFNNVQSAPGRVYGQILDNLNKAAFVGFELEEIQERLMLAWMGDERLANVPSEVQDCAITFRKYCLDNNLLDFSLQLEVFFKYLWSESDIRRQLIDGYRHIIFDNIEEDTPAAHDLVRDWLPECETGLVICDTDGGLRTFLGADTETAKSLAEICDKQFFFKRSFVTSPDLRALAYELSRALNREAEFARGDIRAAIEQPDETISYYPEMLDWATKRVAALCQSGVPMDQIVILAPFMPNNLLFSIENRLKALSIPSWSLRPSRPLKDEPAAQCILILSALAHPQWHVQTRLPEVVQALVESVEGLDPIRGYLLSNEIFREVNGVPTLLPVSSITKPDIIQRVTATALAHYEHLREWLLENARDAQDNLDLFVNRLFGEVLSQEGYKFHTNTQAGAVTARLIRSIQYFREALELLPGHPEKTIGQEYYEMAKLDIVATQHTSGSGPRVEDAVLIAPAYSYLMSDMPVDYQVWLNIGDVSWWARVRQPLTHPYVLTREWQLDHRWNEAVEFETNQTLMNHLVLGLLRRCRKKVLLGICDMDEFGMEDQGPLLHAFSNALRHAPAKKQPYEERTTYAN